MAELTKEEYYELDDFFTKNTIMPSGTGNGGFFAKRRNMAMMIGVDGFVADYLTSKMIATKKTPSAIIRNLVKKELAMV